MKRPTIIPRIITPYVDEVARFVRHVFGGMGETHPDRPTEIRIGECVVMISDGGGARDPMPAFLYIYVADTDLAFQRAVELGATVLERPTLQFYGDKRATVKDRWGNVWQIATPQEGPE